MPPKVKITKEEILQTAISLVRTNGAEALNARAIAVALNCSTQPIFTNFASMEELMEATFLSAYDLYLLFLKREAEDQKYPQYKAFGMAYIRFAKEEKELFKLLFMCDRQRQELIPKLDFEASVNMIMTANGITRAQAELMHLEMWSCVHGLGVMHATSFVALEWDLISDMLTDVYQGLRTRHLSREEQT